MTNQRRQSFLCPASIPTFVLNGRILLGCYELSVGAPLGSIPIAAIGEYLLQRFQMSGAFGGVSVRPEWPVIVAARRRGMEGGGNSGGQTLR